MAFVETYGRADTEAQIGQLDVVPRRRIPYRGVEMEEMDLDAVLARRPAVAIVDELAHTNVPGSRHAKRFEDVIELLDAGIHVMTAVNIQHIETLNDAIARITGVQVRETVPDTFLDRADEVINVDVTTDELRNRLRQGKVYRPDKVEQALTSFFRKANLTALRELALRLVADEVGAKGASYRAREGPRAGAHPRAGDGVHELEHRSGPGHPDGRADRRTPRFALVRGVRRNAPGARRPDQPEGPGRTRPEHRAGRGARGDGRPGEGRQARRRADRLRAGARASRTWCSGRASDRAGRSCSTGPSSTGSSPRCRTRRCRSSRYGHSRRAAPGRAEVRETRMASDTPSPAANPTRVVVATTVLLSFISFWRAAAIVLGDLGSSAFYVGGIAEQAIGKAAPWFILGVMLFSYAVRAIYIESSVMFVRGGVYRVVKEAMGGTLAKLSVSALLFDYVLTGPISAVSAGQYIAGLLNDILAQLRASACPSQGTSSRPCSPSASSSTSGGATPTASTNRAATRSASCRSRPSWS